MKLGLTGKTTTNSLNSKEKVVFPQLKQLMHEDLDGKYAIIAIYYNYIFDNENDLALREWDKLHYQNQIKEYIYIIAHKLQAAVFLDDMVSFFIVTSREMLDNVFFKQQEHIKLLQFGQQLDIFRVFIGIGLGNNMLEAKSRSTMALNNAIQDVETRAYIADNEKKAVVAAISDSINQQNDLQQIAKECGLSVNTLQNIKKALTKTTNPVTAEKLTEVTGLKIRSINRIISKLEDVDCATIVAKETNGKGRPARVIKINLP